jgi:hypothetical protein
MPRNEHAFFSIRPLKSVSELDLGLSGDSFFRCVAGCKFVLPEISSRELVLPEI